MSVLRIFDPWRNPLCTCPRKYTINPYTGCSHKCLYCYATSYIGYRSSSPKRDLIRRLLKDLKKINPIFPIDMSLSSDPYPPEEKRFGLTRRILEILLPLGLKFQITTKSDLFVRDMKLLSKYNVAISVTLTTLDNNLASKLEPFAPHPSARLRALEKIASLGIPFSVRIDPIIPMLNDDPEELRLLVREVASLGAKHIVTSTYKAKPDNFKRMTAAFPELEDSWMKLYYPKGKMTLRYAYLPKNLRIKLISPVITEAKKLGLTYATCREGFLTKDFFNAPTCDGTHLIPERTPIRTQYFKQKIAKITDLLLK